MTEEIFATEAFELDHMSAEFGRAVEATLNEEAGEGPAGERPVPPEGRRPGRPGSIRTKIYLVPERVDPIRVIDIQGSDRQAGGRTHVRSTGEVGPVRVVKTESKGKAFKRMRIELGG